MRGRPSTSRYETGRNASANGEPFRATATLPAFRLPLRHGNPLGLPDEVIQRMFRDFKNPGMRRAVRRLYRATNPAAGSEDLHQRLSTMGRPALVIWGARDPCLPVRYAHRQQDTFANAEMIVLPDSGHWPMIDSPVAVEAPVTAFLHRFWPAGRIPRGDAVRRTALSRGVFKRLRR